MKDRYRHQTQKAITARFSITDYQDIEREAELIGTTLADVIRKSWEGYKKQEEMKEQLSKMEFELKKSMFEICCAVSGLTDDERREAYQDIHINNKGDNYE